MTKSKTYVKCLVVAKAFVAYLVCLIMYVVKVRKLRQPVNQVTATASEARHTNTFVHRLQLTINTVNGNNTNVSVSSSFDSNAWHSKV